MPVRGCVYCPFHRRPHVFREALQWAARCPASHAGRGACWCVPLQICHKKQWFLFHDVTGCKEEKNPKMPTPPRNVKFGRFPHPPPHKYLTEAKRSGATVKKGSRGKEGRERCRQVSQERASTTKCAAGDALGRGSQNSCRACSPFRLLLDFLQNPTLSKSTWLFVFWFTTSSSWV